MEYLACVDLPVAPYQGAEHSEIKLYQSTLLVPRPTPSILG